MIIVALIPAYNEEKMIGSVVEKTKKFVEQVIVVDDGSNDKTGFEAEKAGAIVLRNRKNLGLGRTMRKGYVEARKLGADVVVQLDADMQYDPEEIPLLIEPILQDQADLVLGARLDNIMYDMPKVKRFGNRAFTWILRRLTKQEVFDGQTGFRAIRGETLDTILPTSKFSYTQETILRAAFEGWRIKCVPVHFYQRYDDKSRLFNSTVGFAIRGWSIILSTLREYYPMKFFGYPGLTLYFASFLLFSAKWSGLLTPSPSDNLTFVMINGVLLITASFSILFAFLASTPKVK